MKRLILVVLAVVTLSVTLSAQPRRGNNANANAEKRTEVLAEKLELTKAQINELEKINKTFTDEVSKSREAVEEARHKRLTSIVALLSDEQMVKYLELKEGRDKRQKQNQKRGKQRQRGGGERTIIITR